MSLHKDQVTTGLHVAAYTVADSSARTTLEATLVNADRGLEVLQLDTGVLYVCTAAATLTAVAGVSSFDIGFSFTANGSAYFTARQALTIDNEQETGTGTVAYAKALAADPNTFSGASTPISLVAGDVLRVTISSIGTYKAVTVEATP
jgi:hypothetical protein